MISANTSNALLIVPSGEVYFDRFLPGTMAGEGESYLGNTPGFSLSRNVEEIKRVTSYGGKLYEVASITTQENASAKLKTDNMSPDNFALWFGASDYQQNQSPNNTIEESFIVRRGRWYQLGTSVHPVGVAYVASEQLEFRVGSTVIPMSANVDLDFTQGRFQVLPDATDIQDAQSVTVRFQWRQTDRNSIIPTTNEIVGAMRFVSKNTLGPPLSFFFPYVKLKANNDVDLKVQDFLSIEFDIEIRKLSPSVELYYMTQYGDAGLTSDENAIVTAGGVPLEAFPYLESVLDEITNNGLFWATLGSTESAFGSFEAGVDAVINETIF